MSESGWVLGLTQSEATKTTCYILIKGRKMDRIERAIYLLKNSGGNKLTVNDMADVLEAEINRLNELVNEHAAWREEEVAEIKSSGINIDFNDHDTHLILDLAEKKGLKIKPLMQQALRLYQIIDSKGSVCQVLSGGEPSKTGLLVI